MHQKITKAREDDLKRVLAHYGCKPSRIAQIKGGIVNQTFLIDTPKNKLVLRESNTEKTLEHLKFEIAILRYLKQKKFPLTARVLSTKGGAFMAYINKKFYVLQECLPGKNVASWVDLSGLTKPRLANYFAASARFSKAVSGFKAKAPADSKAIGEIALQASADFDRYMKMMPASAGKTLLKSKEKALRAFFKETQVLLKKSGYAKLPKQVVHFDLHPGNFHFVGDTVTALFDFDWARRDVALVDLATTISMSCYHDRGPRAGIYKPEMLKLGIASYRKAWGAGLKLDDKVPLLTAIQRAYDTYQFLFIVDFYAKDPKTPDALKFLKQYTRLILGNDYAALFKAAVKT